MEVGGGCHCGAIRYRGTVDPEQVSICHCTDCQRLTGSAYRVTVLTPGDQIRITAGRPKAYVAADNGDRSVQHFSGNCGSPLFFSSETDPQLEWGLRWGSINQRAIVAEAGDLVRVCSAVDSWPRQPSGAVR